MKKRGYQDKILVTGGMGFIGNNLINYLLLEFINKYDFTTWDTKIKRDIFDLEFEKEVKKAKIVVHLAALTSVEQSFKHPEETFRTNVLGTARVVELCQKYNKKLIFSSSAAVKYPDLSPYAKSKWLAEEIVKGYKKAVVLRFSNVFGEGMNPDSGSIMYNFLTAKELKLFGDGEQTRDYIHVRDICRIIEASFKDKWNGKIVECGTGQTYTANYVAGLFAHFRGLKIEYMPPRREIKWDVADTNMLKTLYKKKLYTNLKENIEELCLI
jgi:UDP-glucose 4-epimerase